MPAQDPGHQSAQVGRHRPKWGGQGRRGQERLGQERLGQRHGTLRRVVAVAIAGGSMLGVAIVLPVVTAPSAVARPVTPETQRLSLGSATAPAPGAVASRERPAGAPVSSDAAQASRDRLQRRGVRADDASPTTVSVRKEDTELFRAVGVSWAADQATGSVSVAVRVRPVGGEWSSWQAVGDDSPVGTEANVETPAPAKVRGGTDLVWTGPADAVEVSVTNLDGKAPRDVAVDLIDPQKVAADAVPDGSRPVASADAAVAMPTVYSRAAWGADESKMTWTPDYASRIKAITLHHTVSSNGYGAAEVPGILRSIYQFHAVSRGWGDIGYNVLVDRFGRLWEGRKGGLTRPTVGAHAGGFNTGTAGISMIGDYSTRSVEPAVKESVARFAAWKLSLYRINPTGTVRLTGGPSNKYPAGTSITLPVIFPHRLTSSTACPGDGGMAALPYIRNRAGVLMGNYRWVSTITTVPTVYRPSTTQWWVRGRPAVRWGAPTDLPVLGDYNGDTTPEIALWRPSNGAWYSAGQRPIHWGASGDVPLPADWDGDGDTDPAVWRPSTHTFWIYPGRRAVVFGQAGDIPAPADYDGDGAAEIAVFRPSNGRFYLWDGRSYLIGQAGDVPVPGDYDGDGKASPAIFRPSLGRWQVVGVNGWWTWGRAGDVPVPGRYDGLGRDAMVFFRPSTGQWWMFGRGLLYTWGASGDIPQPMP